MRTTMNRIHPTSVRRPLGLLCIAALAAVSFGTTPATAGSPYEADPLPPNGRPGDPGRLLPLLLQAVELSDEQRGEIKQILGSHRRRIGRLFLQLTVAQRDLADYMYGADAVTDEELERRITKVQDIRTALMREGVTAVMETRGVLTDAQVMRMAETSSRYRALRSEMVDLFRTPPAEDATVSAD